MAELEAIVGPRESIVAEVPEHGAENPAPIFGKIQGLGLSGPRVRRPFRVRDPAPRQPARLSPEANLGIPWPEEAT